MGRSPATHSEGRRGLIGKILTLLVLRLEVIKRVLDLLR